MRRLNFSETKRTPRYSMRKLNVGMASVLLGVTIFGINFSGQSVKADTVNSNLKTGNSSTVTESLNSVAENQPQPKEQSNNNQLQNSSQLSSENPNVGGNESSAQSTIAAKQTDSGIQSDKVQNKLATVMLMGNSDGTVDDNNINTQPAEQNKKLANEHDLTSSDNYSSNIYEGKDNN